MISQALWNRLKRQRRSLAVGALIGLIVGGGLLAAIGQDPPEFAARRQEIANLAAADKEHLERNFERFEQLGADQQQQLRDVYAAASQSTQLLGVAEHYFDWVKMQSPWQRESLRAAADPQERLHLVEDFRAEEDRRGDSRGRISRGFESIVGNIPTLSAEDLNAAMDGIVESLAIPEGKRQELAAMHPLSRYQQVFSAAIQRESEAGGRTGRPRVLSGEVMDRIVGTISDTAVQKQFSELADPRRRKVFLVGMLLKSIEAQFRTAFSIDDAEMRQFFEQLDGPRKDRLLAMPYTEQRRELSRIYAREKMGLEREGFGKMFQAMWVDDELRDALRDRSRDQGNFLPGTARPLDSQPSDGERERMQERRFGGGGRFPRNRPGFGNDGPPFEGRPEGGPPRDGDLRRPEQPPGQRSPGERPPERGPRGNSRSE